MYPLDLSTCTVVLWISGKLENSPSDGVIMGIEDSSV